jgi:hypothetical protein
MMQLAVVAVVIMMIRSRISGGGAEEGNGVLTIMTKYNFIPASLA